MRFCQYSDLFGLPGQGPHSIRLFDFALIDIILTFLGAFIIQLGLNRYQIYWSYWTVLGAFFIVGIFLHWLFCVPTKLNQILGLI